MRDYNLITREDRMLSPFQDESATSFSGEINQGNRDLDLDDSSIGLTVAVEDGTWKDT